MLFQHENVSSHQFHVAAAATADAKPAIFSGLSSRVFSPFFSSLKKHLSGIKLGGDDDVMCAVKAFFETQA